MSGDFRIIHDDREMREYLARLDEKGVAKILRKGISKGAPILKRAIQSEAPVKSRASAGAHGSFSVRKRGGTFVQKDYGTPGGLKASVKFRRIKSNSAIGVVVGPMGKQAFMRHWITQGTKAHLIRPKSASILRLAFGFARLVRHPGSKPNAFVTRAEGKAMNQAVEIASDTIQEEAAK